MNCEQFKKSIVTAFNDGPEEQSHAQVVEHLKECRACRTTLHALHLLKPTSVDEIERAFSDSKKALSIADRSTVTLVIDLQKLKMTKAFFALHPIAFETADESIFVRSFLPSKGEKEALKLKSDIQQTIVERLGLVGKELETACNTLFAQLLQVLQTGKFICSTLDVAKKIEMTL